MSFMTVMFTLEFTSSKSRYNTKARNLPKQKNYVLGDAINE